MSSSWKEYLEFYHEQKRLEEYQKTRVLVKPKTTKFTVAIYIAILSIIALGFVAILLLIPFEVWIKILVLVIYALCTVEIYGRFLAIKVIECYQHYATEEKRRRCKCIPSCSEYAVLCLKKYEFIYALLKIRKRLFITCKGFDYIIDNP